MGELTRYHRKKKEHNIFVPNCLTNGFKIESATNETEACLTLPRVIDLPTVKILN